MTAVIHIFGSPSQPWCNGKGGDVSKSWEGFNGQEPPAPAHRRGDLPLLYGQVQ